MEKDAEAPDEREEEPKGALLADPKSELDDEPEAERIAAAGRKGRRVGTVIMVVFGAWFVAATVYNFAIGVFGEK